MWRFVAVLVVAGVVLAIPVIACVVVAGVVVTIPVIAVPGPAGHRAVPGWVRQRAAVTALLAGGSGSTVPSTQCQPADGTEIPRVGTETAGPAAEAARWPAAYGRTARLGYEQTALSEVELMPMSLTGSAVPSLVTPGRPGPAAPGRPGRAAR